MEERRIGRGASPLSQFADIKYSDNVFPWCQEPTESAVDNEVTHTALMFASALGKTDGIVTNIVGWGMTDRPTNQMSAWPSEQQRDKYSRDVIESGLIESTPCVQSVVVEKKSRDTGRTITYKKFAGGSLNLVAAGSPLAFRGPRIGIAHAAEVDGMGATVGVEGDPVELIFKRCEGFADAIKIVEGTPTLSPRIDRNGKKIYRSRIQYWFERSDQRKWFCPCRQCGHRQVWMWAQIRWPKGHMDKGMLHCEKCDAAHDDKQRMQSIRKGKWQATAPFTGIRGYWLNGINSLLPAEKGFRNKIHQFIEDWNRAATGMDPQFSLRTWKNTFLCEVDDPEGETEPPPEWKSVFLRREDYATESRPPILPERCLVLTVGVDVHKNRLEVNWGGHGRNNEFWGIMHNKLPGEVQDGTVWKELERELRRTFPWARSDGPPVGLSMALVDAGKWPEWIYWFLGHGSAKDHRPLDGSPVRGKVRACRGSNIFPHPHIDQRFSSLAKNLKGHWIGPDEGKDLIYTRLRLQVPEDGTIPDGYRHYPLSYPEQHFEQLTSERVSIEYVRGEEVRRYKNEEHARNETLDCENYGEAAFKLLRPNWDAIEEDLRGRLDSQKEEDEEEEKPRKRKNWITGGGNW